MNHAEALVLLRQRLLTVVVATTGNIPLTATGTGYSRIAGSFVTDGFKVGMEVVPAGFASNPPAVIENMSALTIRTAPRAAEAEAPNRSLTVGIPLIRVWENDVVREGNVAIPDTIAGRWFIDEDYLPGPATRVRIGRRGPVEHYPQYVLRLSGIAGKGATALYDVGRMILNAFPPRHSIPMSDGYALVVASSPAPSMGQILPDATDAGRVELVLTIPLIKRSYA